MVGFIRWWRTSGVDLEKIKMIAWNSRDYEKLTFKTQKYDLFINVSYLDHQPSVAKKSIYYVLFPTPIRSTFLGFIKYETILPFLRNFLIIPEIIHGVKPVEDINLRGGKWLREKNALVLSNTPNKLVLKLRFYTHVFRSDSLESVTFQANGAKLKLLDKFAEHKNNILVYKLLLNSNSKTKKVIIRCKAKHINDRIGIVSMTVFNIRFILWNFLKRYLPTYEMALYGSAEYKPASGLKTYDLFYSDSKYTKKWTQIYWNKESRLLYPPVDIENFKTGRKKNIIVSVGRFFLGGHTKRQDVMIRVFKKLVDLKRTLGWELHLVGSVASGWENAQYYNRLTKEAAGYPIFFHPFMKFSDLVSLYSKAKIYWHATGYEARQPIEFEHFGITPVEAMAAGCVPIVFEGGGLTETVKDNGYTWESESELFKLTSNVANNEGLRRKLSKLSIVNSRKFSKDAFVNRFLLFSKNIDL